MVTAGVYLIARTHGLFLMTPEVLHLVGIVGAVTLLLAGFAALVQTDIKRVPVSYTHLRAFIAPICNQSANASAVNALP